MQRHSTQPVPYYPAPDETRLRLLRVQARVQLTLIIIAGLLVGVVLGGGTYLLHKNWDDMFAPLVRTGC